MLVENRAGGPVTVAFLAERTRAPAAPSGIAGGEPGASGAVLIDGKPVDPKTTHLVEVGGRIDVRTPGGGGFGPASERDPAAIASDRAEGYV
jgi:N-methylhydantoinase B